ncbi:ribonuclease HI [Acholeplasma sp. CAG:878]|nr:ribonuclease HI [Acholeplasma sp. CAG:878]
MEVYINPDDIETYIKDYSKKNIDFVFSNYIKVQGKEEYTCNFFISGKQCKVKFYVKVKKMSVKMMPIGKNAEESNRLIKYLAQLGYPIDSAQPKQTVFSCNKETIEELIKCVEDEFSSEIQIKYYSNNRIRFIGYNKDHIDITFYPQTNKVMIQGRPFKTFGIIMTLLSQLSSVSLDSIIEINNMFTTTKISTADIRETIKANLSNSYTFLDEALIKSLSGSITSLKTIKESEDYTCCVTGAFKTLEGYLTKVLVNKYSYKIDKKNKFSMFYKDRGNSSKIENDKLISNDEKEYLIKLNKIYSNKRNVFLHATIEPSQTRIIENWQEAKEIVDEIIENIEKSYNVFYK